jgi:hypothetical protein
MTAAQATAAIASYRALCAEGVRHWTAVCRAAETHGLGPADLHGAVQLAEGRVAPLGAASRGSRGGAGRGGGS